MTDNDAPVGTTGARPADDAPSAVPPSARIDAIDVVRGVALLGVILVNAVTDFRISIFQQFLPIEPEGLDGVIERLVIFAVQDKAFSLFSFLFGVGLAIQFERFSRGGHPYYFLTRRLVALLGFGLVHLVLIWNGDILTEYALAGLIVLPLLRSSQPALAAAAIGLLLLHALLALFPPLVAWPGNDVLAEHVARANGVYAQGSFIEILGFSVREIALLIPLHVHAFPRTLGLFVLGAWVWRSGLLRHGRDNAALFSWLAVVGILVGAKFTSAADPFLRNLAPAVFAVGYGSLIFRVALIRGSDRVLAPFAAIGRMAFTNYILHSLIFSFIFMGYGLGLFGKVSAGSTLLLVVAVYSIQVIFSSLWLSRFRFGPLEWLWRTITYGQAQRMSVHAPTLESAAR